MNEDHQAPSIPDPRSVNPSWDQIGRSHLKSPQLFDYSILMQWAVIHQRAFSVDRFSLARIYMRPAPLMVA